MVHRPLVTKRLILRRWQADDVAPFAAMCADPEVMRWIGSGTTRSAEACAAAIERYEADWDRDGFGLSAVELRDTGRFVGFVGLATPSFLPEVLPAVEIGWRLDRDAWGSGFATEGAAAVLRQAFDELGLQRVLSIVQVGNAASERIARKLGMNLVRATIDPTCGRPVQVFAVSQSSSPGAPP